MEIILKPGAIQEPHRCPLPLAPNGFPDPSISFGGRPGVDGRLIGCDCGRHWEGQRLADGWGAWSQITRGRARRLERRARRASLS